MDVSKKRFQAILLPGAVMPAGLAYPATMADRLAHVFADFTVKRFPERHHFDPPHRAEPEAFARMLRGFWERTETGGTD